MKRYSGRESSQGKENPKKPPNQPKNEKKNPNSGVKPCLKRKIMWLEAAIEFEANFLFLPANKNSKPIATLQADRGDIQLQRDCL